MKTLQTTFPLLLLLFLSIGYGQNYTFDKIVKSSSSTKFFPNQEWTHVFNSEDDSYYMQIYKRNDSLVSRIFDTKESKVHFFYVDKSDSLQLKFMETKKMIKNVTENKFEFSEVKEKKGTKEITFKILNKKNRKVGKYNLKIKKTDKNYFSIFKLSALETLLFTEIVTPMNFMVLEARGRNASGVFVKYKLKSIEDINLSIIIPK